MFSLTDLLTGGFGSTLGGARLGGEDLFPVGLSVTLDGGGSGHVSLSLLFFSTLAFSIFSYAVCDE